MTLVYTHENLILVMNINTALQNAGIKTQIKNQYAAGGRGEIPCFETWPEVWVTSQFQLKQAQEIVANIMSQEHQPDWYCQKCNEQNGAAFDFCWQCDTAKPH